MIAVASIHKDVSLGCGREESFAARGAAFDALHLEPQSLVLVVGAHSQQLVDGGIHRALVGSQHRFYHVVVHVRKHGLEIGHRLRELELHCGCHVSNALRAVPEERHERCAGAQPTGV